MIIPRANVIHARDIPGGEWARWAQGSSPGEVMLNCPVCRKVFSLSLHRIDAQGGISPSVVCPRPKCSFHATIRLDAWN